MLLGAVDCVIINRQRLVEFYDICRKEQAHHVSGITGLIGESIGRGLLLHKFRDDGFEAKIVGGTPKTGKRRGPWLDCWIAVNRGTDKRIIQVEIKNWSAYSLNGSDLPLSASEEEYRTFAKKNWNIIFKKNKIAHDKVLEVLKTMNIPEGYADWHHRALLCFWFCLHPNGDRISHFPVQVQTEEGFPELEIFSMSAYLRNMAQDKVDLDIPWIDERLKLISSLFGIAPAM